MSRTGHVRGLLLTRAWVGLGFLLAGKILLAQHTDTVRVRSGLYGVFQRDEHGKRMNPTAFYDTNWVFVAHASYRKEKLHGQLIYYDTLGRKTRVMEYRKGRMHGSDISYYPDGRVQLERSNRKGKADGPAHTFHPNGNVQWTLAYRKGTLFGERVLRDSTGALVNGEYTTFFPRRSGHYTTICTEGRPDGKLTVYRSTGEVMYTGGYKKGFPDGEFIYYDRKGDVVRRESYKNGKAEWIVGIGIE